MTEWPCAQGGLGDREGAVHEMETKQTSISHGKRMRAALGYMAEGEALGNQQTNTFVPMLGMLLFN